MPIAPTHWWELLQGSQYDIPAKSRWKILREGAGLESLLHQHPWKTSWQIIAQSGDASLGAIKCLLRSQEFGDECEMVVLFPKMGKRATVCVSSQIGCGVGCRFCSTGTMGLRRNLSSKEILEQVYLSRRMVLPLGRSLRNVVFMGMGEPMHNCDAVWDSLSGMVGEFGFGLSPRSITVSSAIGASSLIETAKRFPRIRIALSLHAANADLRRKLVPRSPSEMDRLKDVILTINQIQKTEPVWLEMTMLKGINDSRSDIEALVELTDGLNVQVNLIPFNPIPIDLRPSGNNSFSLFPEHDVLESTPLDTIYAVAQELRSRGLVVRVRHSFGDEHSAACGQLALASSQATIIGTNAGTGANAGSADTSN